MKSCIPCGLKILLGNVLEKITQSIEARFALWYANKNVPSITFILNRWVSVARGYSHQVFCNLLAREPLYSLPHCILTDTNLASRNRDRLSEKCLCNNLTVTRKQSRAFAAHNFVYSIIQELSLLRVVQCCPAILF